MNQNEYTLKNKEKILEWVVGNVNETSLEERILNGACFLAFCICAISISNFAATWGMSIQLIVVICETIFFFVTFYLSRFKRLRSSLKFFIFMYFVMMYVSFFTLGGIDGGTSLSLPMGYFITLSLLPSNWQRKFTIACIVMVATFITAEAYHPEWITRMPSREERLIDYMIVSTVSLTFIGLTFTVFRKSYDLEKKRVQEKNKKLEMYQRQLVEEKERAEHLSSIKTEFLSTMSHELRTPLNGVIGMTDYMMRNKEERSKSKNLEVLKFSAENLMVIIDDILDYNKLEAGKVSLESIQFDLNQLLELVVATYSPRAEEKKIKLFLNKTANIPNRLIGDKVRLIQVLNNLVSNAVKFTHNGNVTLKIEHELIDDKSVLLNFEVKDSGIGIPEDKLKTIFERFTQADASTTRNFGGTGLGLSICKMLVDLQNGKMDVESIEGEGSTFSFSLQYDIAQGDDSTYEDDDDEYDFSFINVLLAEDNEINILVAKQILNMWGVSLTIAKDGVEAVERFKNSRFDIVLMDINMPRLDGYQSSKRIRRLETNVRTPILALTATIAPDLKEQMEQSGMDDFVLKPFQPEVLKLKIAHLLRENKQEVS